ncbi:DUF1266 domain-containing protein [Streptomyces iconiensis]|uniref:DUF1266 domain-containing protein n=1 Tax=Streptomyces iconiensis TaxID=1384038 RepID=A0ABT6ZWD1_9ACTN|nr:DUF1266 domain-containing protein [Streptomyces iconiensis]MDJ1133380.1 DUF1266 domain-containing protein [Streptomyces iconiensis]
MRNGADGAGTAGAGGPGRPGGPGAAAWTPPSAVEQALLEAKSRLDWSAYLDVLAATELYHAAPRGYLDANPGTVTFTPTWRPEIQAYCVAVFTAGLLPAPAPDPVFFRHSLGWFARAWAPADPPWLAVNPGTPCEAYFYAGPGYRGHWEQHHDRGPGGSSPHTLRTLWIGGPRTGRVAHGLACGALLCVHNGSFWNAMGWHGQGYPDERQRLRQAWGLTSRETWLEYQEDLLRAEMSSPVWEFALRVRRALARDFGGHVDVGQWRRAVEHVMRERTATITLTPEGVTRTEGPTEEETDAHVEGLKRLVGRITRYESRFRADGLLPEGGFVTSVASWDYGRASKMARWGLGARYCTLEEAENAVVRAGRAAAEDYRSWEEFSVGYVLGRCLHFDDEEFGSWYQDMLTAHRVLTTEPDSPWLTIPFR